MERLIFGVLIIFQYYGVNSEKFNFTQENGPTTTYMVKQVTNSIDYVAQIYYLEKMDHLIYGNMAKMGTVNVWDFKHKNESGSYYFHELSDEVITFVTPLKSVDNKFLLGSNLTVRTITKNATDYTLSKPLRTFEDYPGFIIYAAHCDINGIMFVLLVGIETDNKNSGRLFRIEGQTFELMEIFNTRPGDFRFNENSTVMYMVNDHGTKITQFPYNSKSARLGEPTDVFDINNHPRLKGNLLTSVVPDSNPGHVWVSAAGKNGYVVEINLIKKKILSMTPVPSKDLTFITFGTSSYDVLYVGSKKTCTKGQAQGAIYSVSGMKIKGSEDRPIEW